MMINRYITDTVDRFLQLLAVVIASVAQKKKQEVQGPWRSA